MFKTYLLGFAIVGTVWSAVTLPRATRWWVLIWLGLVLEGVSLHLTGWLGVVVMWTGVVLIMGTIYATAERSRRASMARPELWGKGA